MCRCTVRIKREDDNVTVQHTYLFPYEKIPQGSRILIYGAGDVGQDYLQQMLITGYCEVIALVDKSYDKYPSMIVPVIAPDMVINQKFDFVVIALKTSVHLPDIKKNLHNQGVETEKIIFIGTRNEIGSIILANGNASVLREGLAYEKAFLSIALKYGPGIGDAIIKKRLFKEIVKMAPQACIDIYTPGKAEVIESIYADEPNLNMVISDGGISYALRQKEYRLSMSIFFLIEINYIDYEMIRKINADFADKMKLHKERHLAYGLNSFPAPQNYIHFGRSIFKRWNCYSIYNYTNVFDIRDMNVHIPLDEKYNKDFKGRELKRYITLNYGNGVANKSNEKSISKQWPKVYFEKFINLFKNDYSEIEVIQLGDKRTDRLMGVDRAFLGENLELVKYILKNALFHLDIEGGLMHLATQLGTKCVVIYGPTQLELFGYSQNINIVSTGCKGCYPLYPEYYKCAREYEKPECMWSIKPERVFKEVDDYLKELEK